MTPHETGSTATPGDSRATAPLTRTGRPPGADPGRSQRRLSPGLPGPAVPVPQHRSRPDRPSRTAFFGWQREVSRPDQASDRRSTNSTRRAPGRPPAPSTGRPRPLQPDGHPRRPLGLARHRARLPRPPGARIPPARASSSTPNTSPSAPTSPPRGRTSSIWHLLLRLAQAGDPWHSPGSEIGRGGGVIRLSPARSKTLVGHSSHLAPHRRGPGAPAGPPVDPDSPLVFHRDGIPIRRWRTAWRTACQAAGVPARFLHDCRRTAARNLIRASVPERVAMLLTGHKSRAIFDRYNIIHEQELLDAGDQLVEYLAQQAQAVPARRRSHAAGPATPRTASPLRLVRRGTA